MPDPEDSSYNADRTITNRYEKFFSHVWGDVAYLSNQQTHMKLMGTTPFPIRASCNSLKVQMAFRLRGRSFPAVFPRMF